MSDQQVGKKMVEEIDLEYFATAYQHVTGRRLAPCRDGERPDFICRTQRGWSVGVELTHVPDPDRALLFEPVWLAAAAKADKMARGDWTLRRRTILVLQVDVPLSELRYGLESVPREDYDMGFMEIWVADYSGIDAYGNIELFGLHPPKWYGYHRRPNWDVKPYG